MRSGPNAVAVTMTPAQGGRGRGSERAAASMPGIVEHRFNQLQEIEAILEYLNIELRRIRSKSFKKYLENYQRALSSRDVEKYVDGEADVIDMEKIINEFALQQPLLSQGIGSVLMPVINKGSKDDGYEGAIVLEPKCGLYLDNPISVGDFASLYPSSMLSENLCPSSKVWTKIYDLAGNLVSETGEKMEIEGHEINLKEDEIYVLGDNPKESIDSRNYGPVKTNSIVGKIFLSF